MKKLLSKYFIGSIFLISALSFFACGSDDDDDNVRPNEKSASATLAGTYKGSLSIPDHIYDVTLTVTDLGNDKVRVSTDKGNTTSKDIAVKWNTDGKSILGSDGQGVIVYMLDEKYLSVVTKKTSDTDVMFSFETSNKNEQGAGDKSAAKAVSGTYKGSLSIPDNIYDVTLTVTDLGNGKVRVATDKGNTTSKDIAVKWNIDKKSVLGSDGQGVLIYTVDTKHIQVVTKATAESDVVMAFESK